MFSKKNLMLVGILIGSFLVINVGMYFFLQMTQPKIGARSNLTHAGADSTAAAHGAAKGDSSKAHATENHAEAKPADSKPAEEKHAESTPPIAAAIGGEEHAGTEAAPAAHAAEPEKTEAHAPETAKKEAPESERAKTAGNAEGTPAEAAAAVKAGDSQQIAKLAKMLETLKPDEAADIASELTIDQIVDLVMRMKDRTAGKMLAAMPTEQSAKVAVKMSQSVTKSRGRS
jgi:flagellar motility protein MotE (MotC chaperone)